MNFKPFISLSTVFCILLSSMPSSVHADNTISGGSDVSGAPNASIAISDWQVTGSGTIPVHLYVPSGTLSMTTTTGLTFTGSSTGSSLYFSGNLADVNAALATLHYTNSSNGAYTVELSLVEAGQILYPANGHVYEVVNNGSSITADAARTAALARSYGGVSGYLATITSQEENDFISGRLTSDGWFGASDAAVEGDWKWLDGPEAGTTFWTGLFNGVASGYENWSGGEPNNAGNEDCSEFYANGSGWNDLPCTTGGISSYVVEYGAPGNLVSNPSDSLTVTVAADAVTQTPTLTSPTSTSTQKTLQLTYSLPEAPTAGTVTVSFNNGTTTTTLTMGNSQSVDTTVNLTSLASTSGVASTTASTLADGTYTVTLSYQDYLGNPASTAVATSVIIDTTGPVQSALVVTPSKTTATVALTTNEGATSSISYGPTSSYGTTTTISGSTATSHSGSISGLSSCGSTYHYQITTTDALGNVSTSTDATFVTHCGSTGGADDGGPSHSGYSPPLPEKKTEEPKKPDTPMKKEPETPKKEESTQKPETKNITLNSAPSAPVVSCDAEPYLTKSIKLGADNNPEDVKLLEKFLNTYENAGLPVDGIYSRADFAAVIKWQEKYAHDILTPWGIKKGTGFVYIKSLAKIKEIEAEACAQKKKGKV